MLYIIGNRSTTGDNMLAAVPERESRHLHSFYLALRLVEQGRIDIPNDVADHFDEVIGQVRLLLADVASVKGVISPEAIALLLEIRGQERLRNAIGQLPHLKEVQPDTARTLLLDMEQRFAAAD